jgi:hypothetical protein
VSGITIDACNGRWEEVERRPDEGIRDAAQRSVSSWTQSDRPRCGVRQPGG